MTKTIKPWDELSRAEKIKHIFDYPESMRNSQAQDLWGAEASGYNKHIYFPPTAPWKEVIEVIKNNPHCYARYDIRLTDKDFKFFDENDMIKLREKTKDLHPKYSLRQDREYYAYLGWRNRILRSSKPEKLNLELYDDNRIVCKVCTEEGDSGDEYGFGVEPDMWAIALFDFEGNVIQPFVPGFIFSQLPDG